MFCGKCGAEMEQGMKFCTHCGAAAAEEISSASAAPVKKKGKAKKVFRRIILSIAALFLLFGIAIVVGYIEIKNVSAEIPHPSSVVDADLREELSTYMDGSVLIADTLQSNPDKKVKDYLHMLIEDCGFYAEDSYTSHYNGYSKNFYVKYDVSVFGKLAYEVLEIDIPGVSVSIKREKTNEPFVLKFFIDEEISVAAK